MVRLDTLFPEMVFVPVAVTTTPFKLDEAEMPLKVLSLTETTCVRGAPVTLIPVVALAPDLTPEMELVFTDNVGADATDNPIKDV
jgi:hypothetical protein